MGFCGAFLASLMGLAVCAGLLFKAWDEQTELANYRADYGVYDGTAGQAHGRQ